jgi:tRNA(Ile)-lysidine synthase
MPSWRRSSPTRRPTSSRRSAASGRALTALEVPAASRLTDAEFAGLVEALGPFERAPHLAVAVSGGPDSLALGLLAAGWAWRRGGAVTTLTVDHGLRPESAGEADQVGAWLAPRGIAHWVLPWPGPKPASGIQAAAREARYRLLADWCRTNGVLHLLLAHHLDDQAETVALRSSRQSGPDGLAGMAPVREIAGLRLLRPLLTVPKQRLLATLRAAGQRWIEDPSNRAASFARSRLRLAPGLSTAELGACAAAAAEARAALDRRTATWLAVSARIDPAGFVAWEHAAFLAAPIEIARRALQQALLAVGNRDYPPRGVRLGRLLDALRNPGCSGRTLAGCRILLRGTDVPICREPAAIAPPLLLEPSMWRRWDRRFLVRWQADHALAVPGLVVRALGADGWRESKASLQSCPVRDLPPVVRVGLPSFWQGERLLAVPTLGLNRAARDAKLSIAMRICPRWPLAGPPFAHRSQYRRAARDDTFASVWREPMLR